MAHIAESHTNVEQWDEAVEFPMPPEELSAVRRLRNDPDYLPLAALDSVHECFNDRQLRLLGPFLGCRMAPTASEIDEKIKTHPCRLARPRQSWYREMLETLARYCFLRGSAWDEASLEISARRNSECQNAR